MARCCPSLGRAEGPGQELGGVGETPWGCGEGSLQAVSHLAFRPWGYVDHATRGERMLSGS